MDPLSYSFFQNALVGLILISVVASMVGTYIVTRRMVFISGGITHACFGGLGLGYFLGISPLAMAAAVAVGGSLAVDRLARNKVRRDSAIAVIWALGMALGILFVFMTSGYVPELNSFLFGNVLTISPLDISLFVGLAVVVILIFLLWFRPLVAISFDPDFARTRGLPVTFIQTLMTVIVALTIVLTIRMIGIMLLMSMLSLPQIIAEIFTRRYLPLIILSGLISIAGSVAGLFIAYAISVPASAAIVLLLAITYTVALAFRSVRRRMV